MSLSVNTKHLSLNVKHFNPQPLRNDSKIKFQAKWRSMREGFNSEMYLLLNQIEFIKYIQDINVKIPFMVGTLQVKDFSDIKYFAGLETDNKALIKIVHTKFGAEEKDFFLQCDLHGSNTLNTNMFWRNGLNNDIQYAVKNIGTIMGYIKLEKTWMDFGSILDLLHENMNDISQDLSILANMELRLLFKPFSDFTSFFREISVSQVPVINSFVEYYIGGIEHFCFFG